MILYTKTICPKCILVKSELTRVGQKYEMKNIDHDEEARKKIVDANIMSLPVLEVEGEMLYDVTKIMEKIEAMSV